MHTIEKSHASLHLTVSNIPVGTTFGRLTVIGGPTVDKYMSPAGNPGYKYFYPAVCSCAEHTICSVRGDRLLGGRTKSCGCYRSEMSTQRAHLRSNPTKAQLHRVWYAMLARCTDPTSISYKYYGGRKPKPIFVSATWMNFEAFYEWALANGYRTGMNLSIDRIDTEGPYSASNCRWIPRGHQQRNRRDSRMLTAFGERKCLRDWSEDPRCAVSYETLSQRYERYRHTHRRTPEEILTSFAGGVS